MEFNNAINTEQTPDINHVTKDSLMAIKGMNEEIAEYFVPNGQVLPVVFGRRAALEYMMQLADGMLRDYVEAHPEHADLKEPCYMLTGKKTLVYASKYIKGKKEDGTPTLRTESYYLGFIDHDVFEKMYLQDGLNTVRNVADHDAIIRNEIAKIHFADDDKNVDWKVEAKRTVLDSDTEKAIRELWWFMILTNQKGDIKLCKKWADVFSGAGYAEFYKWCVANEFKKGKTFVMPQSTDTEVGPDTCSITETKDENE